MIPIKMQVKWKSVNFSDARNCDECNIPFIEGEARILGENEKRNQFIIHIRCKLRWETRTGAVDISNH